MRALNISPLDGAEMPCIFPAISEIGKDSSFFFSEDDFWTMAEIGILRIRDEVRIARKQQIDNIKRGKSDGS